MWKDIILSLRDNYKSAHIIKIVKSFYSSLSVAIFHTTYINLAEKENAKSYCSGVDKYYESTIFSNTRSDF